MVGIKIMHFNHVACERIKKGEREPFKIYSGLRYRGEVMSLTFQYIHGGEGKHKNMWRMV